MEEWNIQSRHDSCSQCHASFAAKDPCHTILTLAAAGYQRQDLCRGCWDATGGPLIREKAGVISYWQGVYEPPEPPPPDPLPKEDAESLLRRMIERNDAAETEAKYILAVMLERKRILRHRETQKDGARRLIYEHLRTGEVFIITDPQLRLDRIEDVQRRVVAMLNPSASAADAADDPAQRA